MADFSPPQKPSRYRSQKRVDPSPQDESVSTEPPLPDDDNVARSKSRYRRRAPTVTTSSGSSPPNTAQPELPQQDVPSRYRSPSKPLYQAHIVQSQQRRKESVDTAECSPNQQTSPRVATRAVQPSTSRDDPPDAIPETENLSGEPAQLRARQSVKRHTEAASKPRPPTPPPLLPETIPDGHLFPPPKPEEKQPVRIDGPPRSGNIRATRSMSELRKTEDDPNEGGWCFTLFKRKRTEIPSTTDCNTTAVRPKTASKADAPYIKPGGGGIVPGTDAPVSAVNAGDRRVLLECGQSKTLFPVTPTTTPVDLLKSASLCMSENIDVKSAVILESFITVGVQRPLRRYEHLRDVMNSWDNDSQNSLILLHSDDGHTEETLTVAGVPKQRPEDKSWVLQFSQKPGKWERRVVSLKSDGQITCQKNSEKTKDLVNLCHLSDFDIYIPTQERARKKIKPPKKFCFAIKSQQKSNMFESTQNFVHFFSTGDKTTADSFHASIQGWRSWYLVNVMGEGQKQTATVPTPIQGSSLPIDAMPSSSSKGHHRAKESIDSHYQLGTFQPLLDIAEVEKSSEMAGDDMVADQLNPPKIPAHVVAQALPERRVSVRRHPPTAMNGKTVLSEDEPLGNFNRRPSADKRRPSVDQKLSSEKKLSLDQKASESDEFRSTGLLGRSYSQRQREYAEREVERSQPFTEGPSLLNGAFDESNRGDKPSETFRHRQSTRRPVTNSGDLHASKSTRRNAGHTREGSGGPQPREMPKPLVDLTPEYREPAHHIKKGRGFHVDSPGPDGLVASATSPDETTILGASSSSSLPSAAALAGAAAQSTLPQTQSLSRSATLSRSRAQQSSLPSAVAVAAATQEPSPPQPQPFTGEGLLAGSHAQQNAWVSGTKGRGVMDGSRVVDYARPMLDIMGGDDEHNNGGAFAQGSLLDRHLHHRVGGPTAPIIDREKREEVEVKYGEGF